TARCSSRTRAAESRRLSATARSCRTTASTRRPSLPPPRPPRTPASARPTRGHPAGRPRKCEAAAVGDPLREAGRKPDDDLGLRDDQVAFPAAMAAREFLFTSESVTEGHPDQIASTA